MYGQVDPFEIRSCRLILRGQHVLCPVYKFIYLISKALLVQQQSQSQSNPIRDDNEASVAPLKLVLLWQ